MGIKTCDIQVKYVDPTCSMILCNLKNSSCIFKSNRNKVLVISRHRERLDGIVVPDEGLYTFSREAIPYSYPTINTSGCKKYRCANPSKTCYSILSRKRKVYFCSNKSNPTSQLYLQSTLMKVEGI